MADSGKILITGAAGFVGVALCRHLHLQGYALRVLLRPGGSRLPEDLIRDLDDIVESDGLDEEDTWRNLLTGVTAVVHLAARVHSRGSFTAADLYFQDNLDITAALARAVLKSGVKKFIFLSTIKVNGEGVLRAKHRPYRVSDSPRPRGPYAISKWRAEQELQARFDQAGAPDLIIIRPPLIYGNQAKGNYALLQKWLSWGLPVPVPRAGNQRSLLALEGLVKIISNLLSREHPVSNMVLLTRDRQEWSTEHLVGDLASKVGRSARTVSIPEPLLRSLGKIFHCEEFFLKFFGSLRIEADKNSFDLQR